MVKKSANRSQVNEKMLFDMTVLLVNINHMDTGRMLMVNTEHVWRFILGMNIAVIMKAAKTITPKM